MCTVYGKWEEEERAKLNLFWFGCSESGGGGGGGKQNRDVSQKEITNLWPEKKSKKRRHVPMMKLLAFYTAQSHRKPTEMVQRNLFFWPQHGKRWRIRETESDLPTSGLGIIFFWVAEFYFGCKLYISKMKHFLSNGGRPTQTWAAKKKWKFSSSVFFPRKSGCLLLSWIFVIFPTSRLSPCIFAVMPSGSHYWLYGWHQCSGLEKKGDI